MPDGAKTARLREQTGGFVFSSSEPHSDRTFGQVTAFPASKPLW
jgi:hypothetical protein